MDKNTVKTALKLIKEQQIAYSNHKSIKLSPELSNGSPLTILQRRFALDEIGEVEYQRKLKLMNINPELNSIQGNAQDQLLICKSCGEIIKQVDSKY